MWSVHFYLLTFSVQILIIMSQLLKLMEWLKNCIYISIGSANIYILKYAFVHGSKNLGIPCVLCFWLDLCLYIYSYFLWKIPYLQFAEVVPVIPNRHIRKYIKYVSYVSGFFICCMIEQETQFAHVWGIISYFYYYSLTINWLIMWNCTRL